MSYERRKIKIGKVVSDKMDKTIVVSVEWRQPHRVYKKNVRNCSRFKVHDASNECRLGDTVRIIETKPTSKTKRWKVEEILQKGDVADLQPSEINVDDLDVKMLISIGKNESSQNEVLYIGKCSHIPGEHF